jgi:tetratricopeptide (TPR) repeat protein
MGSASRGYSVVRAVWRRRSIDSEGISFSHGAVTGILSMGVCVVASYGFAASSGVLYMFASPWLLYFAYSRFGRDIRSLGGGLSERQNFKRQLEAATLNPRDADAHYQLGLMYAQRRSFEQAEKSFRRALDVNPKEPEALFQLVKLLRQQSGRDKEALEVLERAVAIDSSLSNYEIWRELGALALAAGRNDVALPQLEHYVSHREYDPEGLVLLGQALRGANREADAKAAFEKAIEAVKTAPSFRRHALKRWQSQARQELRRGRSV